MAIAVSPPATGRLTVQKITDYQLHLAASRAYLTNHADIKTLHDLKEHRIVGYIPDMIFDKELDYLAELGVARVPIWPRIRSRFSSTCSGRGPASAWCMISRCPLPPN